MIFSLPVSWSAMDIPRQADDKMNEWFNDYTKNSFYKKTPPPTCNTKKCANYSHWKKSNWIVQFSIEKISWAEVIQILFLFFALIALRVIAMKCPKIGKTCVSSPQQKVIRIKSDHSWLRGIPTAIGAIRFFFYV